MSRCKACDKALEVHESMWDEEKQTHDDMCHKCRAKCYIEEEDNGVDDLLNMYIDDEGC